MSTLLKLARAGYEMEKAAEEKQKDSAGRTVAKAVVGGALAYGGYQVGRAAGIIGSSLAVIHKANKAIKLGHDPKVVYDAAKGAMNHAGKISIPVGKTIGAGLGAVAGVKMVGHTKHEKTASEQSKSKTATKAVAMGATAGVASSHIGGAVADEFRLATKSIGHMKRFKFGAGLLGAAAGIHAAMPEKKASEDTFSRKVARVGGAVAGMYVGGKIGHKAGLLGGGALGAAMRKNDGVAGLVRGANVGAGVGAIGGGLTGIVVGGQAGHGFVRDIQKTAGLLDIAKGIASTAKGVGSVGLNLAKQNPGVTKALAGGAAAGVAGAVANKVLGSNQQTKQAEVNQDHRSATVLGGYVGAGLGGYGVVKATDAHLNAVEKVKGVNVIHNRAKETVVDHKSALKQTDRAALYKKLTPSAKVSLPNKLWSQATRFSKANWSRNMLTGIAGGAVLGAYTGHKAYKALTGGTHEKAAAAANRALAKKEKADGPVDAATGSAKATSSLIASAKAEMAKPA